MSASPAACTRSRPSRSHQGREALGAEPPGRDLRLHVADHEVGRADVVAQDGPHRVHAPARLVDLDGLELQALGVRVDGVDDAAGAGVEGADVEVVGGRDGVADELAVDERGHAERDVGAVRGAVVGRVVHQHVALLDDLAALLEAAQDAAQVAGDGAELERGGVGRLGELAPLRVEQRRAEVLGLADDRRVAHARQPPAHLQGDGLQRAAQHLGVDRADRRRSRAPPTGTSRLPASSAVAA